MMSVPGAVATGSFHNCDSAVSYPVATAPGTDPAPPVSSTLSQLHRNSRVVGWREIFLGVTRQRFETPAGRRNFIAGKHNVQVT